MKRTDRQELTGAIMTPTILRNAVLAGLGAMLASTLPSGSLEQIQRRATGNHLAQYCAPPPENFDAPRVYCGNRAPADSGGAQPVWSA
jgi:hypothetical protein